MKRRAISFFYSIFFCSCQCIPPGLLSAHAHSQAVGIQEAKEVQSQGFLQGGQNLAVRNLVEVLPEEKRAAGWDH